MENVSRWLVGSSRMSRSGRASSARARATRRFSPAGKLARQTVGGGAVEVVDERADAVFHVPAVEVINVVEEFAGTVGVRRLVFVGVDEVEHGARAVEDVALHGAGVVELEILRQVAGDEFAAADDVARVGFGDPGGDAQERYSCPCRCVRRGRCGRLR